MSQPESNGTPRNTVKPIILADGTPHYVFSDDDPDAIVETWPNCGPSDFAFPPKKDDVRETRSQELLALMNAMTAYKRKRNLEYLLWEDVLGVLHDMGYRKVAPPAESPAPAAGTANTRPATGDRS
jgi:hypothetical protein